MNLKTLTIASIGLMILPISLIAQPPGAEDFYGPEGERSPRVDRRLEAAAEYLELTDGQEVEWEEIIDRHRETVRLEWQDLTEVRQQFRDLADTDNPDLTELGSLALMMHRRSEALHDRRSNLDDELASILSPDQVEKFEALKTARETVRPRGHRERPQRGQKPDSSGGVN